MVTRSRAVEDLFRREAPLLERYLRRFGPLVSPEDIAQESFAKLCARDQSTIAEPRAYLFQTARNLARNALRDRRTAPLRETSDSEARQIPAPEPSPEDAVFAASELVRVSEAIAALPERQREALLLFKLEGWSRREIGAYLGVSHRTAERYVAEALATVTLALAPR